MRTVDCSPRRESPRMLHPSSERLTRAFALTNARSSLAPMRAQCSRNKRQCQAAARLPQRCAHIPQRLPLGTRDSPETSHRYRVPPLRSRPTRIALRQVAHDSILRSVARQLLAARSRATSAGFDGESDDRPLNSRPRRRHRTPGRGVSPTLAPQRRRTRSMSERSMPVLRTDASKWKRSTLPRGCTLQHDQRSD